MSQMVVIHVQNEDPIIAEMEALPEPTHTMITIMNPRKRDGRPLHYITEGSVAYIFPVSRISFIEIMAPEATEEEIISFFR